MNAPSLFPRVGRIHMVGIGGIGMSGIAEVLLNLGHVVSGSDLADSATTRRLAALGAAIHRGHAPENVEGADVVVTSSAVSAENVEVRRARELGVPIIPRAEMLAELMRLKHGIAVAGSHGKTTTTSLVAQVVAEAGLDPTIVVGGRVGTLGSNARLGRGHFMVCEADESDGSFLKLSPTVAVVTNIDAEHLEAYGGSLEALSQAFVEFCNKVPFYGAAILCLDDPQVQAILPRIERRVVTYGLAASAEVTLHDFAIEAEATSYTAVARGAELGRVTIHAPGRHVALNSLAAVAVARELSIPFQAAAAGLAAFRGVERRLTTRGEAAGVRVVDDYAHHPTEIVATLQALRDALPGRRVVAVFQPHRYSRVAALHDAFCRAFNLADVVLACDVYAAGEKPVEGVTGEALVAGMRAFGHRGAEHVGTPARAAQRALEMALPGDVVVTLGAGDVWKAGETVLEGLLAGSTARRRSNP
jgi:UDP-N-acetylmuramate--alanine ligase